MDRIKFRLNTGRRILKHFEILDGLEDQYVDKLGADGYIRKTTHELMNKVIEDDKRIWKFCLSDKLNYVDDFLEKTKLATTWYTLDINPRQDITLTNFVLMCHTWFKKDAVMSGYMVFEQRGDTQETCGNGFHVHMNIIYSRCRTDLLKSAQKFFLEVCTPNNINVKVLKTEEDLEKRQKYIMGQKCKEKMSKVIWDIPFREKNKIEKFYSKNV